MVMNPDLLTEITKTEPLRVHCSAGTTSISQYGKLGTYPEKVWLHPDGIANILSLANVARHYQVTMDITKDNCLCLHLNNGDVMRFTPLEKGVYRYEMPNNQTVNDVFCNLQTVEQNKKSFSKQTIKQAEMAIRLQNIIMRPSSRFIKDNVIRSLKNCPISAAYLDTAEQVYGPNLGSIKGKTPRTTQSEGRHAVQGVPQYILNTYRMVSLSTNIFFINKVAFIITKSHQLQFITMDILPNRQVQTITAKLRQVIHLYEHQGFQVGAIYADPEFEPIESDIPILDICGADDHIGDIEREIQTVKNRCRSTYRMLPYRHLPRLILIHLVNNVVFWRNAFPVPAGVTQDHSPHFLITGFELDYNKHVRAEFGSYVQLHHEHTNDMLERTVGAICLSPTGSQRGTHYFYSLATGNILLGTRWTALPIPQEAIQLISQIGRRQKMPPTLTFANCQGNDMQETIDNLAEYDDEMNLIPKINRTSLNPTVMKP